MWEGAAAVVVSAVIDGNAHPIDTAGVDVGFLFVTTKQVTVGHRKKKLVGVERLTVWEQLGPEDIEGTNDHPMGVAFIVSRFGPADLVIAAPARDLDGLYRAVDRFWSAGD